MEKMSALMTHRGDAELAAAPDADPDEGLEIEADIDGYDQWIVRMMEKTHDKKHTKI